MTTKELVSKFMELLKENKYEQIHSELYHEDIVSIENPVHQEGEMKYEERKGMAAKNEKSKEWQDMVEETHNEGVGEPIIVENAFAVAMWMDVTMKDHGRMKMEELCIYSVKDGKIVREEFIY